MNDIKLEIDKLSKVGLPGFIEYCEENRIIPASLATRLILMYSKADRVNGTRISYGGWNLFTISTNQNLPLQGDLFDTLKNISSGFALILLGGSKRMYCFSFHEGIAMSDHTEYKRVVFDTLKSKMILGVEITE